MLALVFQVGDDRLALDVRGIHEVTPRVRLHALTCGPSWLAGTLVYRGRVVPILDLHRLAGLGDCPVLLNSRIILVPQPGGEGGQLLGLLASEVSDLQEVDEGGARRTHFAEDGAPDFGAALVDRKGVLRLLDLERLLPDSMRHQLPGFSRGQSP